MRLAHASTLLLLAAGCASAPPRQPPPPPSPPGTPEVRAVRVAVTPVVDGIVNDSAWAEAPETEVRLLDTDELDSCRVRAAVHGGTLYLLVRWRDSTEDRELPTVLSTGPYSPWDFRWTGDLAELTLPIDGPFPDEPLDPFPSTRDLWRWDAMATDRAGHARDGRLLTTRVPGFYDHSIERNPVDDAGTPPGMTNPPSGSAADVLALGAWKDGEWTVEWARALSTGNGDDRDLAGLAECPMAIQILDRSAKREFMPHRNASLSVLRLLLPPPLAEDRQGPFPDPRGAPGERR